MSAPKELNLTLAAEMLLVADHVGGTVRDAALAVWAGLTGLPADQALAYAEELASNPTTPTRAAVIPF